MVVAQLLAQWAWDAVRASHLIAGHWQHRIRDAGLIFAANTTSSEHVGAIETIVNAAFGHPSPHAIALSRCVQPLTTDSGNRASMRPIPAHQHAVQLSVLNLVEHMIRFVQR